MRVVRLSALLRSGVDSGSWNGLLLVVFMWFLHFGCTCIKVGGSRGFFEIEASL